MATILNKITAPAEKKANRDATLEHAKPYHQYPNGTVGSINGLSIFLPPQMLQDAKQSAEANSSTELESTNFEATINNPCIGKHGTKPDGSRGVLTFVETALTYAVKIGLTDAVKLLLESGADPFAPNVNRETPIELALKIGNDAHLINIDGSVMRLLLEKVDKEELINFLGTVVNIKISGQPPITPDKPLISGTTLDSLFVFSSVGLMQLKQYEREIDFYGFLIGILCYKGFEIKPFKELLAYIYDVVFETPSNITQNTLTLLPQNLTSIVSEYTGPQFDRVSKLIPQLPINKQMRIASLFHKIKQESDFQRKLEAIAMASKSVTVAQAPLLLTNPDESARFTPGYAQASISAPQVIIEISQSKPVPTRKPNEPNMRT